MASQPLGMLDFTGGSPGNGASCLFSLHKDFHVGPPLWQCSCISSPSVTLPCRKVPCLLVASCCLGFQACIWAVVEVLDLQKCKRSQGDWKPFFLSLSNRHFLTAGPDGQSPTLISMMREINNSFCCPTPERETALGM